MTPAETAELLEYLDSRRVRAELWRDGSIAVGIVVPIVILLVIVRLAFAGTTTAWFGPAAGIAGIVFLVGIAAAIVFGTVSASRTRELIESVADGLGRISPWAVSDGERIGDLIVSATPSGLVLDHRQGLTRLRANRLAAFVLATVAGVGAGFALVMILGQGVSSVKGVIGAVGMGLLALGIPLWLIAARKPLAVGMLFDRSEGVLRVTALSGVIRIVRFDIPFELLGGTTFDHQEVLGARRVRLIVGDRALDIARFAIPRTNSRSSRVGGKKEANEAHEDLCAFRADRLHATFVSEISRVPRTNADEGA